MLNVNIKELKKAALNLKTFSTCFNLFELQEPVIVSLLEVSEAVRPTRKNQNRKAAALFWYQYQNEVSQKNLYRLLVLESINLYIESIILNLVEFVSKVNLKRYFRVLKRVLKYTVVFLDTNTVFFDTSKCYRHEWR